MKRNADIGLFTTPSALRVPKFRCGRVYQISHVDLPRYVVPIEFQSNNETKGL